MDPKIRYEVVEARRPYLDEKDDAALDEQRRLLAEADESDGTNDLMDAILRDTHADDEE